MTSTKLLCNSCKKLLEPEDLKRSKINWKCPVCGSEDIRELKVFSSGDENNGGPPPWDFVCEKCLVYFQFPVPRGPDEARQIVCPECKSKNITRHNACTLDSYEHACG